MAVSTSSTTQGISTTDTTAAAVVEGSPPNSPPPEAVAFDWPSGTITCAEIEGNFPVGVDDHGMILEEGIVTYWQQPDGGEERIQFMDDPTCTADSEAWMFMIRYLLDPEGLQRSGLLCDFYQNLLTYDPPPANLDTVLTQIAPGQQLCK